MSLIKQYFPLFGRPFLLTLGLVACEAACDLLQPTIMSRVIDEGVGQGRLDLVFFDAGLMLLFTLLGAGFALARNLMASRVSYAAGARIRADLYRRIIGRQFEEAASQNPDSLVIRLTNDVTQVQNFLNGSMRVFFKAPILAIGAIVMAWLLDPGLALVLLIVAPVVVTVFALLVGRGFGLFRQVQEGFDRMNAVFREFLAGIRVVKAFDRGAAEEARFSRVASDLSATNTSALQVMARLGPLVGLVVNLGIVAVLWLGFRAVDSGNLRPGHLIAFINYMTQILFALMIATNIINSLVRARASASRISEILDPSAAVSAARPEGCADGTAEIPQRSDSAALGIQISGLAFAWPGSSGSPILHDLDFRIQPGEFVGVLGSTGSGKSSLLGLICGFYPPGSGRVELDGLAPCGSAGQAIRKRIAIVPQKVNLFSGTIRSNLLWGRPEASEAELTEAAQAAGALEFINAFPHSWETVVGRGGVTLSGGQKQRLSIARALLRQSGLLILDDATSAVDGITEAGIRRALRTLPGRPTVIMVAQRIGSVADADRILVLDGGRVAGFDSYQGLVANCAVFREIIQSQTGLEADHV